MKKWISLWHSFAQNLKWLSNLLGVKSKDLPLIYKALHGLAPACLSSHISSHPSSCQCTLALPDLGCSTDRFLALASLHKFYFPKCSSPTYLHFSLVTLQYNVFFFFFSIFGFILLILHGRNYILKNDSEHNYKLNTKHMHVPITNILFLIH